MVGTRISNRCDTCRKRKKKCGGQKPSCSECNRSGWKCPGYLTSWRFVDEAPRLAEHYAQKQYIYDDIDENLQEDSMRSDGAVTLWKHLNASHGSQYSTNNKCILSEVPRHLETNPLGSSLVYCLESKVKGTLIPLWLVGSFFQYVPARMGRNTALDAAVSCLCDIYCSPYYFPVSIYKSYAKALSSLHGCLSDTSLQMESETLCASILLQMCEVSFPPSIDRLENWLSVNDHIKLVINDGKGKWCHLAHGTTVLLHSRGVQRYKSAFDHAMLESQLSMTFAQSLRSKKHCFLRSPEWQALIRQSPVWPFQNLQSQILGLRSRLLGILVDLPSLIVHVSTIHEDQGGQTRMDERLYSLMHKASTMSDDVKRWMTGEAEPLFLSNALLQQNIHGHIEYPDIISGVLDCVANMALLTLGKVLRSLCHARQRWSTLPEQTGQLPLVSSELLDDAGTIEQRRRRAIIAFDFVREKSYLAAKPLEFGLRQVDSSGFSFSVSARDEREGYVGFGNGGS